jgi:hypothetical protein
MLNKALGYLRVLYAWKVAHSAQVGYAPEDISIELTNTCNFRCAFCPQSDPNHTTIVPRSQLTPEKADVLLAKLRQGGVRTDVNSLDAGWRTVRKQADRDHLWHGD